MDGVILFADDNIHMDNSSEKLLYDELKKEFPVLGVHRLDLAEKAIKSIGAFTAVILDWNFKKDKAALGEPADIKYVSGADDHPDKLLKYDFYSLVYIYSKDQLEGTAQGDELQQKFGSRIMFRTKEKITDTANEKNKIIDEINNWKKENQNLTIPFQWLYAINHSAQKIFSELQGADVNWIKDLFDSALEDGTEPTIEVINLFQNLLAEWLVQDEDLRKCILTYASSAPVASPGERGDLKTIGKLFQRIYYTTVPITAPLMTGDIFNFGKDCFAILVAPECDIKNAIGKKLPVEILSFNKDSFYQKAKKTFPKLSEEKKLTPEQKKELFKTFNQNEMRSHVLPCFKFDSCDMAALIDFRGDRMTLPANELNDMKANRICKLNSPFIQQLRQRYLSYIGRVGVPGTPDSLKEGNIKALLDQLT